MSKISVAHTPQLSTTIRKFTSGSGTYNLSYAFVVSNANATVGATYTNNGVTYTIYATVSGAALLYANGSGAPTVSGTLTKSSGTGDSTIAFSTVIAAKSLKVICLGAGGSGSGGGNNDAGSGSTGNNSTFGSSLITGGGDTGGSGAFVGGPGGTWTVNGPAIDIGSTNGEAGGSPGAAIFGNFVNSIFPGASGGNGGLGGGGGAGGEVSTGAAGSANTGGGGGGGGVTGFASGYTAAGAGAGGGGVARALILTPSATYSYSVAAAQSTVGAAGSGTSGAGGAGGSGLVIVEEGYV